MNSLVAGEHLACILHCVKLVETIMQAATQEVVVCSLGGMEYCQTCTNHHARCNTRVSFKSSMFSRGNKILSNLLRFYLIVGSNF